MASKITKIIANFDTQLASTINIGGTTGTLKTPVVDDDGVTAPNGTYVMCIDLGTSKEEHLRFDLDGTTGAMTDIKNVSRQGVETVGAKVQHRTGAKVSLTNYANLLYISKILMGEVALDGLNPLIYDVAPTFSNALQLVTKGYIDGQLGNIYATIQKNEVAYAVDSGAVNALIATLAPVPASLTDGLRVTIRVSNTNTGATTLNINSLGAKSIVKNFNTNVVGGDLVAGQHVTLTFDAVNDRWQMATSISSIINNGGAYNNANLTYDSAGRLYTVADLDTGLTYTLSYNLEDNISSVTDGTNTWTITYDGSGNITNITKTP